MPFFLQNERWLSGPAFLLQPEEKWPKTQLQHVPETSLELKKEVYVIEVSHVKSLDELIKSTSCWLKCLRKIAWLQKFVKWIECKKRKPQSRDVKRITLKDLEDARRKVIKLVQRQAFKEEITRLVKSLTVKGSRLASLKPILDEEAIIRVGGRISKAPISRDAANPMILPRKHHVTEIYIRFLHEQNGHCGHEQVLALSREFCWILKARAAIREVLNGCIKCKRRTVVRQDQEMAELPKARLTPYEPAFTYSGVDYFGPFFVKRGRGKTTEKRWGVIFTCMNSRAVHLEVARSLEADDFILVLVRFLNRRGHVKEMRSDNGTHFVGAEREVREAIQQLDETKINNELSKRGCKWVFHPPGASHMSGVWERLVRTVKRSLKAIVGKDLVNEEVLQTVFTEAERIANARPLTRNPLSPNDDEPLTPNHFLNVRLAIYLPPEIISENDKYSKKKWRRAQLLANHYWRRWLREYIPTLQERKKWNEPKRNLQVDDLVFIADDNVPRNTWPMGRIVDVFPGPDGRVRTIDVRSKNSVYRRPVAKVCLLEAADDQDM
ncbi:uncharacterized protein LOC114540241 [Dendronephthya gigantea]|uniref:uncharacterized protein LOC114540241 n=1 Tax=Dendronephthya gigantea TaxID=151771 RepID=UPI001069C92D|nr:uncharacterized protein LOC114540241 [Dendronephthya gigantea]